MVNNSININKRITTSCLEALSTKRKKKRKETMTYAVGILGSVLGQAQKCGEVLKFLKSYWWSVAS